MKIALINENSQAAKNGIIEAALKKVVEPMGHEVVNYGMYAADDAAQLTYVQCGILAAILLNSGAADYVITGCGTGEGAMLALNSFPGVICGHVEDPVDAYTFAHVNDGNAVAMPFAKGFGWGGELNLEYCFEKLFGFGHGQGYPKERVEPEQRNKKILDGVRAATFKPLIECLKSIDQDLLKGAIAGEMIDFLNDIASCSDKLSCQVTETDEPKLEFTLLKEGKETGIKFRAVPGGHEFSSLLLAVLNADGKGKNLPDEGIGRRIKALQGPIHLQTYVSLACTNCPDIVQALNAVALLHPYITHDTIDGAVFQEEADALKIQAVPSVYANGKQLHVGRGSLGELLKKLEDTFGSLPQENAAPVLREFDVLVLGGGPAGASAAVYSARKGLRVAIIAERIGGQVKETVGIENLISVPRTTGSQLADALRTHIEHYPIEIFEDRKIERAELQVFAGQSCRIRPSVHKHSGSRAPAEALDAQLAGAGKQVQDLTALNIKLQDVEQPFLHPVSGGAGQHTVRGFQLNPAGFSCDDTHYSSPFS